MNELTELINRMMNTTKEREHLFLFMHFFYCIFLSKGNKIEQNKKKRRTQKHRINELLLIKTIFTIHFHPGHHILINISIGSLPIFFFLPYLYFNSHITEKAPLESN